MELNIDLYREYRKAAGRKEKDGIYNVTTFPNGLYCPPLKKWLGQDGKIDSPLIGAIYKKKSSGEEFTVDGVFVHWYMGYYYVATMVNSKRSHAVVFTENINCIDDIILDGISDFYEKWERL